MVGVEPTEHPVVPGPGPGRGRGPRPEPQGRTLRRAVFLDRDGTMIEETDYLSNPDDVKLIPGVVEALKLLRDSGYALVLVTNQSGIARGYYTLEDYQAVASRLDQLLAAEGITLDDSRFCPHHPEFTGDDPAIMDPRLEPEAQVGYGPAFQVSL